MRSCATRLVDRQTGQITPPPVIRPIFSYCANITGSTFERPSFPLPAHVAQSVQPPT